MNAIKFGDVTKDLHGIGGFPLRDLLPLIPPGAKLTESSKVQPFQIGKIPGRYVWNSDEWTGLPGQWPTFGLSDRDLQNCDRWPTHNVGLRAADFPAIDCDTDSKEALDMVQRLIAAHLPAGAPARERGNAPRVLFVYKRKGADMIRKTRVVFKDAEDHEHAVEVLGLGQQYVVNGIHTSGVAYEWREVNGERRDLLASKVSGLPQIGLEDVKMFVGALIREIQARGWTVTSKIEPQYGFTSEGGQGVVVSNADPLVDNETALSALRAIPNTIETLPSREDLVALVSSFKHATGRNADSLYPDVVKWAIGQGWADVPYIEKVWDSITVARVSPDHLLRQARKYGWRGDAALDFKEFADAGEMSVDEKIEKARAAELDTRAALDALLDKVVYNPEAQEFYVKANGKTLTAEALNNSEYGISVAPAGSTGQKSAANQLRNSGRLATVDGAIYIPGQPRVTSWTGGGQEGSYFNRWHAPVISLPHVVTDEEVKPWLDHAAYLLPNKAERDKLLDFFAHLVQKRGVKVRWAPLMIGKQGTGKDLLIKPLLMFFGHNAQDLKPETLTARFNSFYENELIVVQEMKRSNKTSGVYNSIKTMLSGTAADVVMVEQKYRAPYAVPNLVNMLFFSNHTDAIEIDPDDRRFFVLVSDVDKREPDYYTRLADDFYRGASGWRKVIRWLMQRDLSGFNANEAPPSTSGKELVVEDQRTTLFIALRNLLAGEWAERKVVTSEEVFKIAKHDHNFPIDHSTRAAIHSPMMVTSELRHLGWSVYPRNPVAVGGSMMRFWVKDKPTAQLEPSKVREAYLATKKDTAGSEFE
ncbi:Bifunctional DNA primase/polymerase [Sinorhizobium phage phiM5]|nr:Bifunctional DNA primase/polymerase [Sinorhizobium phage phiM5]